MSKRTEEFYLEIRAKIRKLLQIRPNVSALEISKVFDIDYKLALRELKKAKQAIIEDLKHSTSEKDLSEYAEFLMQANPEIKHIIFDKNEDGSYVYNAKERTFAYNALLSGNEKMLNIKMDLGQYQRNVGKITVATDLTPEQSEILTKALNYATQRANNSRVGSHNAEQETEDRTGNE